MSRWSFRRAVQRVIESKNKQSKTEKSESVQECVHNDEMQKEIDQMKEKYKKIQNGMRESMYCKDNEIKTLKEDIKQSKMEITTIKQVTTIKMRELQSNNDCLCREITEMNEEICKIKHDLTVVLSLVCDRFDQKRASQTSKLNMLKNVFKGKKKDKKIKNKAQKSNSLDIYNLSNKQRCINQQNIINKAKRSKTTNSNEKKKNMDLNDYVLLNNKQKGLIRYIGNVHFGKGEWFGIELIDGSIGNHDGKVGNQRYFKTASKNAKFVKYDSIKKIIKKNTVNVTFIDRKKRKKETKNENSSKQKKSKKTSKRTQKKSIRPNSAKKFDEFFSSNHHIPPPPPPSSHFFESKSSPVYAENEQIKLQKCESLKTRSSNGLKIKSSKIRKIRSHNDEFTHNLNVNDPAVRKLKKLQTSIRKTASRSDDLEQLLIATPPSLPPTPNEPKHGKLGCSKTKIKRTKFPFSNRQRSKSSDSVQFHSFHSEAENTDIEEMYKTYSTKTGNENDNESECIITRRNGTKKDQMDQNDDDEKGNNDFVITRNKELLLPDDSLLYDNQSKTISPRTMGTDAFSRIRSKSIRKDKKYKISVSEYSQNSNNKCPFWNPFQVNNKCPYAANGLICSLLHLSKTAYLDELSEEQSIELLSNLFNDSMFVEACLVIEKLLNMNPQNDEYNTCMADICEELGRYDEASKYYQIALKINPQYDDAHNNYAMMLHHKLNKMKEAEIEYLKCLDINSRHVVCHTNYAKLLQHTLRYKESEKHFKKCLKLKEENAIIHHYYGCFLYEIGRWSEAKYHLSKAINLTKGMNASYHYNLAKLLCDLKEFGEAHLHFKECLKLEQKNASFHYEYALFLAFDLKDIKQSIQYFVQSYHLDPHNVDIAKRYDEIADIVQEHGLKKCKRRKSSAIVKSKRVSNGKLNFTVVEYKDDEVEQCDNYSSVCQSEFDRFMFDNFSFCEEYLHKFESAKLNDIRYVAAIDFDVLCKDISMKSVHAKIMMAKIEKFKEENDKFMQWLHSISLQEYYKLFEQNGILTLATFYKLSNADLIRIIGDENGFDVQLLMESCPKYKRQNSLSSVYNVGADGDAETIDVNGNSHHQVEGI